MTSPLHRRDYSTGEFKYTGGSYKIDVSTISLIHSLTDVGISVAKSQLRCRR